MFFTPKLNHEKRGGEIYFTPETKLNICECGVSEYIGDTVKNKLFNAKGEKGSPCVSLTFALGIPEDVKAKISKYCKMEGGDEEYAVIMRSVHVFVFVTVARVSVAGAEGEDAAEIHGKAPFSVGGDGGGGA